MLILCSRFRGAGNASGSASRLPGPIPPTTLVEIVKMHVVDQGIRDIAKDYRFAVEEVQEFYDKCGEMGLTRSRFQSMRELLSERFKD